ncbi:hypothetical protein [Blastopirellula marina]|uniref:Uncharacterized protein n=1 Tax=Blastopirellula marina TaxID=124 RepID=A0A2S8GP58_9BACT|nr:hypothetical protein [Blastopirellula marina]PQO46210.1 hypothetical protein C5Y93_09495 [Blastopirellula marina]
MPRRGKSIHPRIHPFNYPLFDRYPAEHPAIVALQTHAESCDECVGREIAWPQLGNTPIDQTWHSASTDRKRTFSGLAYMYLSYGLVLDGWLKQPEQPTKSEWIVLQTKGPEVLQLLAECEQQALRDGNTDLMPLIAKARRYVECHREAILSRLAQLSVDWQETSLDACYSSRYFLEHRGLRGEWEHDENMHYFGRIVDIDEEVTFETDDLAELESEFQTAVDAYLKSHDRT